MGAASVLSTVATVGSSLLASRSQSRASSRAADAQIQAAQINADLQRDIFDITREDQRPFREAGRPALASLARAAGINVEAVAPTTSPTEIANKVGISETRAATILQNNKVGNNVGPEGAPLLEAMGFTLSPVDASGQRIIEAVPGGQTAQEFRFTDSGVDPAEFSRQQTDQLLANFEASPDFEFRRSEGLNAIQNAQAARGISLSPFALQDVGRFSSDLASQEFNNFANRRFGRFDQLTNQLASIAGLSQTATQATSQAGQAFAANAGNSIIGAGNAAANNFINQGNANSALAANTAGAINRGLENFTFGQAVNNVPAVTGVSNPAITGFGPQGGP